MALPGIFLRKLPRQSDFLLGYDMKNFFLRGDSKKNFSTTQYSLFTARPETKEYVRTDNLKKIPPFNTHTRYEYINN